MPCETVTNTDLTTIIAIGALIISTLSMIFSIIFSVFQLQHNKNSVRPISHIRIGDYENLLFVEIHNVGTGPLSIKHFKAKNHIEEKNNLYSLMPYIPQPWNNFTEDIEGRTIPVNGKITLVELEPNSEEIKFMIRNSLSKIKIELEYTDVYGKTFRDERKLTFFARTIQSS